MREGDSWGWSRPLGLLASACLVWACGSAEPGSGGHTGPVEARGGGRYWSQEPRSGASHEVTRASGLLGDPGPDLVVRQLRGPASVRPYEGFVVSLTACNAGSDPAPGVPVRVYLSDDATVTPADVPQGETSLPFLQPGECISRDVQVFAGNTGTWFLGAIADPDGTLAEPDEVNNAFTGERLSIGDGPDLVVRGLSAPLNIHPSEPFVANAEICNQGTASASSFMVSVVRSPDTVIDGSDVPVGQQPSYEPLMPGACREVGVNAGIPGAGGVFVLGAMVSPGGGPSELRSDNNALAGSRIGVGDGPDLVVTAVAGPPNLLPGPVSGPALVTVCNRGTQPSSGSFAVEVFQSTDATITRSDMLAATTSFPPLGVGSCTTRTVNLQLSDPLGSGSGSGVSVYYLGAIADPGQLVFELQEDNNALMGQRFAMGSLPDLVVKEVSGPARALPGSSAEISVRVCNEGTQSSQSLPVTVVRSTDTDISHGDLILGTLGLPALQPGECSAPRITVYGVGPSGVGYLGALVEVPAGSVSELFADNDALAGNRIDVGVAPDLVVSAVRGPPDVAPGQPFSTRVTVCNQGTQPSNGSPVTLVLSKDADVTSEDMAFGGGNVPPLFPGQCNTQDIPAAVYSSVGVFTLGAIVDGPGNPTPELREDNNAAAGGELVVGQAPDYVVSTVGGPSVAYPGQGVSFPVTVCNQGTVGGASSTVEVVLASGAQASPLDWRVGSTGVPSLAAGQCVSVSVAGSMPSQPGTFTLGAAVDRQGSVQEGHEGNNLLLSRRFIVGSGPDLVVKAVVGPSVVQPSSTFPVSVTVCNEGNLPVASGQATLDFVSSVDTTLGFQDSRLSGVSLPPLSPGQCFTQSVPVSLYGPMGGPRYLGAFVDALDAVQELVEDNNTLVGGPLLVGYAPDMAITSLTVQPSVVTPGTPVNAQLTVCNQGNVPSTVEDVGLFLSGDALINPEDPLLGGVSMPALAPGACATLSLSGTASGPPGIYVVGAIADPWSKMVEAREDNNTFSSGQVASNTMDLSITLAGAPPVVRPGTSFSPEVTVCNGGPVRARGVSAELYLSLDALLDSGDYLLGGYWLPDLDPGQCLTMPMKVSASAPEGNYRLLGRTDSASDPEARKDNNVFAGGTVSVSSRSVDLTVTAVTPPLNVAPGGRVQTTVRVCNQGPGSSPGTRLELFLSADAAISRTADTQIADVALTSMAPGSCRDMTVSGYANVPEGSWWVGAVVDGLNAILEANETNNTLAGEPVRVGLGPDLLTASVQVPTKAVAPTSGFSSTIQVCNRGTDYPSTSARMEVFLSKDAFITDTDYLWASRMLPLVAPGMCTNVAVSGGVSAVGPGVWYVGVRLDGPNAVAELREDNNLHASAQVVVGDGPNLVVSSVTGPSVSRQGTAFTVGAQVCNQGTQPSVSTSLEFVLSGDAVIGPEDTVVAGLFVPGLSSGSCQFVSTQAAYSGAPDGAIFTLGAIVDGQGSNLELREDDNAVAGSRLQFDNAPPSAPTISSTSPNGSGNTTSPYVYGSAEAGARVSLYTDSTCAGSVVGSGTASSMGGFSVMGTARANTTTTFYARATDAVGNVSPCSAGWSYTHDGVAPAAPVLTATNPVSPGTTPQPAFQGTAEPGATVRLYTTNTCTGTVAASGTADSSGGFSLLVTVAANATTTVYASATDAVGNVSACSTGLDYTHQDPVSGTP